MRFSELHLGFQNIFRYGRLAFWAGDLAEEAKNFLQLSKSKVGLNVINNGLLEKMGCIAMVLWIPYGWFD